ncbi:MAG: ATP-binding protein, partial [Planctomycetota bacterium]
PEGLRVMLSNLVDNAIKYTPEEGSVSMRWSTAEPAPTANGATANRDAANGSGKHPGDDPMVRIEVTDTGVGIPEDEMPRVFERFYRVDKARSRELGGTGLGLSIVKHLAQSFGGSVAVRSSPNDGTTFSIELPAG